MAAHAVHDGQERGALADGDGHTILVLFAIAEKA
jgi:hypothetical protein